MKKTNKKHKNGDNCIETCHLGRYIYIIGFIIIMVYLKKSRGTRIPLQKIVLLIALRKIQETIADTKTKKAEIRPSEAQLSWLKRLSSFRGDEVINCKIK